MDELVDRVDRDTSLNGAEKETTITMLGDAKQFTIYSAKPTIVKSLLKHDHFEMDWARVINAESLTKFKDISDLTDSSGDIVAISGRMPIGVLNIKYKPRTKNHQSQIITTETVDPSVFATD